MEKKRIKTNLRLYTVKEVAEYFNLSIFTILRYIHKGKLNATRISDGKNSKFIITEDDLIKYIRRQRNV